MLIQWVSRWFFLLKQLIKHILETGWFLSIPVTSRELYLLRNSRRGYLVGDDGGLAKDNVVRIWASMTMKNTSIFRLFHPSHRTTGRLTTSNEYIVLTTEKITRNSTFLNSFLIRPVFLKASKKKMFVELPLSTKILFVSNLSILVLMTSASSCGLYILQLRIWSCILLV